MLLDFSQGNMTFVVEVDENGRAMLRHFCNGPATDEREKEAKWCPLAEIHVTGENADAHHGMKHIGSYGSRALKYVSHGTETEKDGKRVVFLLSDGRMNVRVSYRFYNGIQAVRAWCEVKNVGTDPLGLEYVSSFSYTGLDAGEPAPLYKSVRVAVPHNGNVRECNWQWYGMEELGLRRISSSCTKRCTVSNTGTWSGKEFLPMGAVENGDTGCCYLWQIEHHGSWQWELGEVSQMLYLKLSGPTEQENHWYKELQPGESFTTVPVALTVAGNFEAAVAEMTKYRRALFQGNGAGAGMPVIFNDYMNCLGGDPTEERELPMIDAAAAAGAEYYCIDAGWYADGTWWETVGEWLPFKGRFPNGIKRVFDYIREKGMIPGIWLEIEVMGIECPLAKEWEDECFFLRHGKRVIDHGRYQLDFRHPRVRAHATAVVDRVVREYGVGYIKMDYNIEAGIGTEVSADSFGDGLLQHNRAYLAWLDETLARYPDLVWENCSSGGMRMDYAMLQRAHIQSVTDQTDYRKMTVIAAAAPTAVLPEQAAVWSYPLADADADAAAFNMVNAMLQRIHLSGKLTQLSEPAFRAVREGVAVYKTYRHLLPAALPFWPMGLPQLGRPWQALGLRAEGRALVALWRMGDEESTLLPVRGRARILYPAESGACVTACTDGIRIRLPRASTAVLLEIIETV